MTARALKRRVSAKSKSDLNPRQGAIPRTLAHPRRAKRPSASNQRGSRRWPKVGGPHICEVPVHRRLLRRSYEPLTGHGTGDSSVSHSEWRVFLAAPPRRVHFVCLVTDPAARDIDIFVQDHAALLTERSSWHARRDQTCAALHRCAQPCDDGSAHAQRLAIGCVDVPSTDWYFDVRQRLERKAFATLSVEDITR